MNKEEFLFTLREVLEGELPGYQIEEHIRYYSEYLMEENGKTAEEKLNELGDPRLIAKTIIDTAGITLDQGKRNKERASAAYEEESHESEGEDSQSYSKIYSWNALTWYQKVLAVIIGILVIAAILGIFVLGVNIFFSIILPVLIVIFIVRLVISIARR